MSILTTFNTARIRAMLTDLSDAAAIGSANMEVVSCVSAAVANLIAGAGRHGGTLQGNMMELAREHGFQAEYYGITIRVTFVGQKD